jgi:hypothetical protein
MATAEQEARKFYADAVGPRTVGKVYHSGYWDEPYTVLGMGFGTEATRQAIGWDSGWSITVVGDDGRIRTHCTWWDPRRDTERPDLCPCLHPYADHHGPLGPHCGTGPYEDDGPERRTGPEQPSTDTVRA